MSNNKFIMVSGYGWSGSGVVVDLLREFKNISVPDVEFLLFKMPYGISQLENTLVSNWESINASIAIKDFLWLCEKCERPMYCQWAPVTLDYRNRLNKDFKEITLDYIREIAKYQYNLNSFITAFEDRGIQRILYLIECALNRFKFIKSVCVPKAGKNVYFSAPTDEEFCKATKKYINSIFQNITEDNCIVLDQAISPNNIEPLKYFDNVKMIVVDRDPRDIYVDLVRHKSLIGADLAVCPDVMRFAEWYLAGRKNRKEKSNIIYMQFEDIVLHYEESIDYIIKFLELDSANHIKRREFFNPDISKKNICLWKTYDNVDLEFWNDMERELGKWYYQNI